MRTLATAAITLLAIAGFASEWDGKFIQNGVSQDRIVADSIYWPGDPTRANLVSGSDTLPVISWKLLGEDTLDIREPEFLAEPVDGYWYCATDVAPYTSINFDIHVWRTAVADSAFLKWEHVAVAYTKTADTGLWPYYDIGGDPLSGLTQGKIFCDPRSGEYYIPCGTTFGDSGKIGYLHTGQIDTADAWILSDSYVLTINKDTLNWWGDTEGARYWDVRWYYDTDTYCYYMTYCVVSTSRATCIAWADTNQFPDTWVKYNQNPINISYHGGRGSEVVLGEEGLHIMNLNGNYVGWTHCWEAPDSMRMITLVCVDTVAFSIWWQYGDYYMTPANTWETGSNGGAGAGIGMGSMVQSGDSLHIIYQSVVPDPDRPYFAVGHAVAPIIKIAR